MKKTQQNLAYVFLILVNTVRNNIEKKRDLILNIRNINKKRNFGVKK